MKLILLILSLACLAANAFVIYKFDDRSKMGVIISVSVLFMDIFTFLLYNSSMVETPVGVVFLIILNRSLMIGLGQNYWIFGYMILYLIYAVAFVFMIAKNRFPFEDDVVLKKVELGELFDADGKKMTRAQKIEMMQARFKKFNNPELLLGILSVFYIILMFVIYGINIKGVTLRKFYINRKDKDPLELSYGIAAVLSLILVLSFYFLVGAFRLSVRKARKLDIYGQKVAKTIFSQQKFFSVLTVYQILAWLACVGWTCVGAFVYNSKVSLVYGVFGSGCLILFSRAYIFFALNGMFYFEDVEKVNKGIEKHNKEVEKFEQKKAEV